MCVTLLNQGLMKSPNLTVVAIHRLILPYYVKILGLCPENKEVSRRGKDIKIFN